MLTLKEDWEFNVLGIYNYLKPGRFQAICNFIINNHEKIEGDIIEAGVYRGGSLIAIAMLLKSLGSDKKIYGYDSFSGFPPIENHNDDLSQFESLYADGKITKEHLIAVRNNQEYLIKLSLEKNISTAMTVSTSKAFSDTSLSLIKNKIKIIGLDNVVLIDGPFSETMVKSSNMPEKVMAGIFDCDLYQSYLDAFNSVWPRLTCGGMIHLDEYYSLKFPGARIAVDEFVSQKSARLEMVPRITGDFERWCVYKESNN